MTDRFPLDQQRTVLRDLLRLAAERAATEEALDNDLRSGLSAAEAEFAGAAEALEERFTTDRAAADRDLEQERETIESRLQSGQVALRKQFGAAHRMAVSHYTADRDAAKNAAQEARWRAAAYYETGKAAAEEKLRDVGAKVTAWRGRLRAIRDQASTLLREWKQSAGPLEAGLAGAPGKTGTLNQCLADAEAHFAGLHELVVPRLLKGGRLVGLFFLLWLVSVYPLGWLVVHYTPQFQGLAAILVSGLIAGGMLALALGGAVHAILASMARSQVEDLTRPLGQALKATEVRCQRLLEAHTAQCQKQIRAAVKRHNLTVRKAKEKYKEQKDSIRRQRLTAQAEAKARYHTHGEAAQTCHDRDLRLAEDRHARRRAEIEQQHQADRQRLEADHQARLEDIHTRHRQGWVALIGQWQHGLARVEAVVRALTADDRRLFPRWDDAAWNDWVPPTDFPPVLRFGEYQVVRADIPHGVPADERLRQAWLDDFSLPALWPFPEGSALVFEAGADGREPALEALHALVYRLLTAIPPGKVRLTIIDPVGLGQSFAGLMQLADHDPLLVNSRIWTEPPHIEQRLADLTAHMENVIQKYLRNRYPTIADYNAEAGEVAEPFRVLVVADFPVNFTEAAARRLVSVCQSGARCGVSALIMVDGRVPLPRGFDFRDLEKAGATLVWRKSRFVWKDEDFGPYPLRLDGPPREALASRILQQVGALAQDARRVEVPFEFIVPPCEQWWTSDARLGLNVPLGRSGATRRQHLQLGKGTAQHVLVAGKTGSGKSTLLHALIVNLALHYSPREVELYLIDFKKGVEFKTYAAHELPHARVVAIESEREFGLSVLQRLDAELRLRGERFRTAGAQDLAGYRLARPEAELPRILLIVDEFQEFFTEDDRIAQDAAQLLDRLVRQGRAFGLHVLLGSQTLGGAYSLARSTIDQMAVRIALQCSEADAQLILSADNSAARLLTRPGEAIYNDANGLVEGNSPFQVVWLPEHRREEYLLQIQERARQLSWAVVPTVFEGNAPADIARNRRLHELLSAPDWPAAAEPRAAAWLGEAMSITGQTTATFRRQDGSNLLIVGQQPEAALGVLATAVISLAAQATPGDSASELRVSFCIIDGSQSDPPQTGALAQLPDTLPHPVRLAGLRQLPALLADVAAELDRRHKAPDAAPPLYLIVNCLQRCRDLRRPEDDFGLMRRGDEAATPSQQLATVLREGPALGVHTLIWCDTLHNLQRVLDRQAVRELGLRVVFQMSVADSSSLIDNPHASKLGLHRALFSSEEDGRLEKFRPYGVPPAAWLGWVKEQFEARARAVAQAARA